MSPWRALAGAAGLVLILGACKAPRPEPGSEPVTPAAMPQAAAANDAGDALPPGVLASARGAHGEIRVEESGGTRRLTIDEAVLATVPIGNDAAPAGPDPLVTLVHALRPDAKSALVIGLGSGKTVDDLGAAGLQVTAIELEPKVIEYARTYFGFRGAATVADGMRFLRRDEGTYDLVLMDAFLGMQAPYDLTRRRALKMMRAHTRSGGLTVVRGLGEPRDFLWDGIVKGLRSGAGQSFVALLGSGVGTEVQTLYAVAGDQPLSYAATSGLAMWPVRTADEGPEWAEPALVAGGATRTVRLVGYVTRLREDGELALDLPHWEKGALRYVLHGDAAAELAARLGHTKSLPTDGTIASDGNAGGTLRDVLGGGGVERSDVRFSPLAAEIEGTVRLRAVVDPDAAPRGPQVGAGAAEDDARLLPYGGALYDLEVTRVVWTLGRDTWRAARKKAAPHLRKAVRLIGKAELGLAAAELRQYLPLIEPALRPFMPPQAEVKQLADAVDSEALELPGSLTEVELAAACDRIATAAETHPLDAADARALRDALRRCSLDHYQRAASDPKTPDAILAAKRLLAIYSAPGPGADADVYEAKRQALEKKYRVLHPLLNPPERGDDPTDDPPE